MTDLNESKKLYDDLNSIFNNNPNINEIGFVISTKDYDGLENKPFVVIENKLGYSFKWLTQLYSYCFHRLIELKNQFDKLINDYLKIQIEGPNQFNNYSNEILKNKNLIFNQKENIELIEKLIESTRNVLSINAENLTALNQRKKLIILEFINHENEIKLLNLIFTKHPKSGEGWAHRKWVYMDYFKKTNQYLSYEVELEVCKRVAEIYPKNYYAWTHRWWILKKQSSIDLLLKELVMIENWIKTNISDYCGYHHRYLILTTLFNQFFNIKSSDKEIKEFISNNNNDDNNNNNNNQLNKDLIFELWSKEFKFIEKIIKLYPGHESSWNYKRTITLFWLEHLEIIDNSEYSNLLLPITSVYKECLFVHSIIQETDSSYYLKQKLFAENYLSSIYQLKLTILKDKDYLGDSGFNIETLKQNYLKLITSLKKSSTNNNIDHNININVLDYKTNKFTK